MNRSISICALVVCLTTLPALAGGIVTLSLSSPSDGAGYHGEGPFTVEWSVHAAVSSGDNMGLAMFAVDMVQGLDNPVQFDLPAGAGAPEGMEGLDRPGGICNPGPGGEGSGYGGTPIDMKLIQVGGAQNTFGVALEGGIGEDADVEANIGQLEGGQIVATGSFELPGELGVYTFSLANGVANTLTFVNEAPKWSPVSQATVEMGDPDITMAICLQGDADGDHVLTMEDVPAFVDLLLDTAGADAYLRCATDLNEDGEINGEDIQLFVNVLIEG